VQWSEGERLELKAWRPSGFQLLSENGSFPQSVRNLEIITIRIAQAIGNAMAADGCWVFPPTHFHLDTLRVSPSGLRWATGWAYGHGVVQAGFGFVETSGAACTSGGITFLPRPDVAEKLKDPQSAMSGFYFPVPLASQIAIGSYRAKNRRSIGCRWWNRIGNWFNAKSPRKTNFGLNSRIAKAF